MFNIIFSRRIRARGDAIPTKNCTVESLHSSASDLSGASPAKRIGKYSYFIFSSKN